MVARESQRRSKYSREQKTFPYRNHSTVVVQKKYSVSVEPCLVKLRYRITVAYAPAIQYEDFLYYIHVPVL